MKKRRQSNGHGNDLIPKQADSDKEIVFEFGGSIGVCCIMVFSHVLPYYLWACLRLNKGQMIWGYPHSFSVGSFVDFVTNISRYIYHNAFPSLFAWEIYIGFLVFQALLAVTLPGIKVKGLPIPSEGNKCLEYNCNGILSWYTTLAVVALLHSTNIFRLSIIIDHFGSLMSVSILFGNILSLVIYFGAKLLGKQHRMSGSFMYDFFMGAWLNPRIGTLDLKMWAEIRISWILLFLLTISAAVKQYEMYGTVSIPMYFMVLAHFLYTNACMKGEECIPTTWDIFYEKWGWMLIYWNCAGVPFVYCFQSLYLVHSGPPFEHTRGATVACFALLTAGYYIWDTANSQKNRFRMKLRGTYVPRATFPQLPWGTLGDHPRHIVCSNGSRLLTDGWYRYARKIHYTGDIMMALSWGLICGFGSVLPYFYVIFFTCMIIHRWRRDMQRCKRKYGKDWDNYCDTVKYTFVPYVF